MNANCYKIIFSKRLGTLIAVGENATSTGKAASGQACRSGAAPQALLSAMVEGFVGVLRLTFASVTLACLSLGTTQAQSGSNNLAPAALPQGGNVNIGSASISTNGAQMAINQTTDKASINWQSFNVGTGASVNITQPSASSVLLNRVVGNDPSQILGKLSANGQLILLNPNGIVFGKDGSVTASTFTASTFGLSDADLMDGFYKYQRNASTAAIVNQGTIETTAGGFVALIGASVTNEGTIRAPQGDVMLVAAENVTLPASTGNKSNNTVSVRMSKRVRLELDPAAINTAINNTESGVIVTEGGQVLLQAAALSTAVASVTHSGRIDTSAPQAGTVTVLAEGGVIKVNGAITANSSGNTDGTANHGGNIIIGRDEETGALAKFTDVGGAQLESNQGFVETSGDVLSTTGTRVKAGEWLLDPYNITIAAGTATGTNYSNYTSSADSTILASDISANLTAGTSVTLATGAGGASIGNIAVNENIAKTGGRDATLTLQAHGNITVAASKTITSNTGKLNVVFNSDSDATGGGGIVFNSGSGITSNGGNITLGGGTALNGTGYAIGDGVTTLQGIALNTATINAAGGNIVMNGLSPASTALTGTLNVAGILMSAGTMSTTGAGLMTLNGKNQMGSTATSNGFVMSSGTITGGSTGAISITGDSRPSTTGQSYIKGAVINGTVTSAGGDINIVGYGGSGALGNDGVAIAGSVLAIGSSRIGITGSGGLTGGFNLGVSTSGSGTISSINGDIVIDGIGGQGFTTPITNHGVQIGGSNAISASGTGNITIAGRVTSNDNGYSRGVFISSGGLSTNTGNIKVDATALQNYQVAAYINAPITSTSGNVYIRSAGANIKNTATGTISGNNVSIDNTGGTIDANGVITKGAGGASTWAGYIEQDGIDINGSVTAANNLNMYGNQTGGARGIQIAGATTVSGKNVRLYGKSNTGNGLLLSGATLSGAYLNAIGETITGTQGFTWSGGNINTTGTAGTSTSSVVKGISAAPGYTNGFGAFMMTANSVTNAASGTSLTFAGESTSLAAGINTNERGILVQGGYVLAATGDITFDGSSKSSEGIAFGGVINMGTVAGVTNKLTIKGTDASLSNGGWNAVNFSGSITGNASTSSINLIGEAKNLSGTNYDNAVSMTGTITGNAANVNVQALYGKISLDGAVSGANISIDNTGGSISATTGTITAGTGTSSYTNAININNALTATGNINVLGHVATTTNTGVNLTAAAPITSSGAASTINIASNGNVVNAASITETGSTGTGANINFTSTSGTITGAGAIGDTNNKNASVTFTQAGTSTYHGAINAANFTKMGVGALTLDSWIATSSLTTNVSNAYTVKGGGILSLAPGGGYPQLNPASVNVENASTFALSSYGNGWWKNTVFNFTGGSGGGTMNLFGNPIGAGGTTNTFNTTGGATNTLNGVLNANNANVNFNLANASSGTSLLDGSFAALAFIQNSSGGYGLGSGGGGATTVDMTGGGNLLFKDKFRATNFNINAGAVQFGDGTAATTAATAELQATNVSIASGAKLIFNRAEAYTNASIITGTGSLIQGGAGVVTLTGNSSTFAGASTVSAGKTLAIGTRIVTVNGTDTEFHGSLGAAGSTLTLTDSTSTLQFSETSGTSTVGSAISGAGKVTHTGAGTGVLTADNSYTGTTTVSGGTLQVGNGGTTGTLGTGSVTDNGSLVFNRSNSITVASAISGTGTVSQVGAGTTILSADNSYTGTTTISGGTLQVGNAGATGTLGAGDVALSNSANLNYVRSATTTIANNIAGTGNINATITGASSDLAINRTINLTGGTVNLVTDGNLSVAQAISTTNATNTALFLQAGKSTAAGTASGGDISFSGSTTGVSVGTGGRATLMTGSVAGSTGLGILTGNNRYNSDEAATNYSNALGVGTYAIYREAPTLSIQVNNADKTYNGSIFTGGNGFTELGVSGLKNGDSLVDATSNSVWGGTAQNALNAGTYSLSASESGTSKSALGYLTNYANGTLTIHKKSVSLASITAANKTYDGSDTATITAGSISTGVGSETLFINGTGTFNDKAAGTGKTVTVADVNALIKTNGTGDWANYNLTNTTITTTATISQAPLTVTATQTSKEYDGLTTASGAGTVGSIAVVDDIVSSFGVQAFTTKDAGVNNKTVQARGVTLKDATGRDVTANYNIQYIDNTTSTITPALLTIKVNDTAMFVTQDARTAFDQGFSYSTFKNGETAATALIGGALTAADRIYTGTSPFPTAGSFSGVYGLTSTPSSVNGNYTITVQKGDLVVAPADKLLITIASQSDTYGQRTASNAGYSSSSNVTTQYCLNASNCNGANLVDLTMTQLAANQWKAADNTGSYVVFDTTVTEASYSTGGFLKVGNYTFESTEIAPLSLPNGNFNGRVTNGGNLTITPLVATLSSTDISKVYDGNTSVTGASIAATNKAAGDIVNAKALSGSYASKNAANGLVVSLSDLSLTGADAANYYLATNAHNGTGSISPKNLTVSYTATNKTYDANTLASVIGSSSDIISGDAVTFTQISANFNNADVGSAKPVSIVGISLAGADRTNYSLQNTIATATADITSANSSSGSGSGTTSGVAASGTAYALKPLIPNQRTNENENSNRSEFNISQSVQKPEPLDLCTTSKLETCTCEEQSSDALHQIAICYPLKLVADTTANKPSR